MKCPYCQKEMEEGYIPFNSPFVLKWISLVDKQKIIVNEKSHAWQDSEVMINVLKERVNAVNRWDE